MGHVESEGRTFFYVNKAHIDGICYASDGPKLTTACAEVPYNITFDVILYSYIVK